MFHRTLLPTACLAAALIVAVSFESVYRISMQPRPPDPLGSSPTGATRGRSPLSLRLVDSGGVGIPLDAWGRDYSHDRRVFRRAILEQPPYVDAAEFRRIELDWHAHVERMIEYGNNAIAVPMLLELINFDRVARPVKSTSDAGIYGPDSAFRARHLALRRYFGRLFEWTASRGMRVFLEADMPSVTPPLADYLRRLAPGAGPVGIDASDPALWAVYRAGLEELFDALPSISGLVIRFGEGGNLYNTPGWPYRSEMGVRNAASLQTMLRGLLPAFETAGRTLVLRSWTVGVGQIGRLHTDPRVYDAVLGGIDSSALIVSTKFTAGDFFSYLPLNPTLAAGRHRRLVELQAKPEFEGFAAFPDFLGEVHARALRALARANPRLDGVYVLTQFGGPLRAGPRTLYPLHGLWLWTDANVFVASRLAVEPDADVRLLARTWARRTFGDDEAVADAVTSALFETREAVRTGFYIRPFAEREVRVPGIELPPLMWIFEWDMVGGWHSLLSLVYQGTRDVVGVAIDEGHAAAAAVRRVRQQLQAAFAAAGPGKCPSACNEALRSLEYQETLFDVLAAWRLAFLSYYRWLDTGDVQAWAAWRDGRVSFEAAAAAHRARFGDDLDLPAFDLTSAGRAMAIAERAPRVRTVALALLVALIAVLALGSASRRNGSATTLGAPADVARLLSTSVIAPRRLIEEPVTLRAALGVAIVALVMVGFLAGSLTGFATFRVQAGSVILVASMALAFAMSARPSAGHHDRGRLLVACLGPLIPGAMLLLALIAYAGPLGFWYWFWTLAIARGAFVTIVTATLLWTASSMFAVRAHEGWQAPVSGWLVTVGAGMVVLTALLPDWANAMRALDRPLNAAPATETMIFALQTYAGVKLGGAGSSYVIGGLCLAGGYALSRSVRARPRQSDRPPLTVQRP